MNCAFHLAEAAADDFTVFCHADLQNAAQTVGEGNKCFLRVLAPFLFVSKRLAFVVLQLHNEKIGQSVKSGFIDRSRQSTRILPILAAFSDNWHILRKHDNPSSFHFRSEQCASGTDAMPKHPMKRICRVAEISEDFLTFPLTTQ